MKIYAVKNNRFILFLLIGVLVSGPGARALGQPAAKGYGMDTALLRFFCGRWTGEGAFAGGRTIAADLSYQLSLDSCWLVYEHEDRAPNRYKATSYWGIDGVTGQFFAYVFDNFHGHRQLVSNGWKAGKLLLSGSAYIPDIGLYFEHFLYERLSDTQFKMTYETSRDGIVWQLGDWLVFTKVAAGGM